jgi:hypothetical protein
MEHPLQVDELPHTDTPPAIIAEPAPAAPALAAAAPLPPLLDLSASDVLFLKPGVASTRIACRRPTSARD